MNTTDPVCGMTFPQDKAAASHEHNGQTLYFCSDACHRQFTAEPERFVAGGKAKA